MSRNDAWMPLHIGDYAADTGHLCDAEHGAYLLLIMHYWRTGPLPDDDARLARIACASDPKRWGKTIGPVVRAFFRAEGGMLRHKRIDAERAKAEQISSKRADAARASHQQRASKPNANAEQMQSKSTASATHARVAKPEQSHEPREEPSPSAQDARERVELPFWLPAEPWNAFLDMRKKLRKPPTEHAVKLLIQKLDGFHARGFNVAEILNNSTLNGWQDVFEPKGERAPHGHFAGRPTNLSLHLTPEPT